MTVDPARSRLGKRSPARSTYCSPEAMGPSETDSSHARKLHGRRAQRRRARPPTADKTPTDAT